MAKQFRSYPDVLAYLDKIPKFSDKGASAAHFALDQMEKFCKRMGNPQKNLKAVHVAGTNGKGTSCQMLASVYQQAGYKAGLYTSPHLVKFNERVKINAEEIPDEQILRFFQLHEELLKEIPLTYFEISTCLAFWYLDKQKCDICLIETGLGGRLDATNVIYPLVSVITSISDDHTDILGSSIKEIAAEKAGIIKKKRPVVMGNLPEDAKTVILDIAKKKNSAAANINQYHPSYRNGSFTLRISDSNYLKVSSNGRKQVDRFNVALAWGVVQVLDSLLPVSEAEFVAGIESMDVRFPAHGHFEKLTPELDWYFDGAHNPEAVKSLVEEITNLSDKREPFIFLSLMKDKVKPELLKNFLHYKNVYYIETGSERCANRNQILSFIPGARVFSTENSEILEVLGDLKSELVIFAGSFYFYSEVKKWMTSLYPSDQAKYTGLRR